FQADPVRQGSRRRPPVGRRRHRQGVLLLISPVPPMPQEPLEDPGLAPPEAHFELNLSEYLGMVRRHWKLLAVSCLMTLVGAGVHYAVTPKEFQSTATIQIERRNLSPVASNQNPWLENY